MPNILIVKTSSLGDIVHALPVVDDIRRWSPDAVVDWVAEEAFVELPRLHPDIRRTVAVGIRRWRRAPLARSTRHEISAFVAELRAQPYDAVIDLQGLVKSAWIASRVAAARIGLDWHSAREPLAALSYQRRISVPRAQHAIDRNRQLAAQALGYTPVSPPALRLELPPTDRRPSAPYAVCLHATSASAKLWPEAYWRALVGVLSGGGLQTLLPWGSQTEFERSRRIAEGLAGARVPDRMNLGALASVLAGAEIVVGVDTGLAHVAAAVGAPVVALYCASDPALTGVRGFGARSINLGGVSRPPTTEEAAAAVAGLLAPARPC